MDYDYENSTFEYCVSNEPIPEADIGNTDENLGCNGKEGGTVGNPCNPVTGNKYLVEQEIQATSLSALSFKRYYNSQDGRSSGLGMGWMSSYSRTLEVSQDSVLYRNETGQGHRFTKSGALWVPAADVQTTLTQDSTGFTITVPGPITERYSNAGKVQSITDATGITQTLTYDTLGHLERVESSTGQYLDFTHDSSNRISTITDHTNRVWTYRYDALSNLEYVDNPDGTTKRYHYEYLDFPHVLTGITDERGVRYATYDYDQQGRVITTSHAGYVQTVDISYNEHLNDGTRTITNSRWDSTTYSTTEQLGVALVTQIDGPGCSTCGTPNSSYSYDPANNNLLSKTDNGIVTQYGNYDSKGQTGYMIEAFGTPQQRHTAYQYDPRFHNKITKILEPSVINTNPGAACTEGTNCKVTSYTYDDWGNRLTETISGFQPGGGAVSRTVSYQYNGPLHQLSQIDGPRSDMADLTSFIYYPDNANQGPNRARLQRVTDALGVALLDNLQYTATGKLLSESRPNGVSLSYSYYPGNDRLETLTESDGTSSRVTRWTYLATGEVESITQGYGSPDATPLTFSYDDARRLRRITDGLGNYIDYQLDTEGNLEAEYYFDNSGALKKNLEQMFDAYNHLYSTTQEDMFTNPNYAPDGTLDTLNDGNGILTDYSYDALKRLTQVVQDQGGFNPATTNASTVFGYNNADRLVSVTDPINGNTEYLYDDLGNLLSQTSPDTGTTTFTYDSAGNLKTKTDAKGQLFNYSYDALNRLTLLDAPGTLNDITYGYDSCANGIGRLCRVSTSAAVVHYRYDRFGNPTALPGIAYTYDNADRLKSLTYPSGAKATYSRDAAGQVNAVTLTLNGVSQTLANSIVYAPFGAPTNINYGNGRSLTQVFDTAYRMQSQSIPGVLELSYSPYDGNGNLTNRSDTLSGQDEYYNYDALNRLDTADGSFGTHDYNYDKNGNRTTLNGTSYAYTPNSNRLTAIGSADVLLDNNGNTLNKGNWTFDYNAHNRLTASHDNGALKASYAYNGLGQRVSKLRPDTTGRHFLYGTNGELLAESDTDGNLLHEYIYLNGQLLALYQPDADNDGLSNAEEDPLGTNPANTDSDGDGLTDLEEWYQIGTDARDADTDNDGILDGAEVSAGTDPLSGTSTAGDGDVNQDGQINAGDLLLVMQMAMGQRIPTPEQLTHADVHTDGVIDVRDVLELQRRILGLSLLEWFEAMPGSEQMLALFERAQQTFNTALKELNVDLIGNANAAVTNGKLYYIHTDHLGTPKAMTSETGAKVWSATHDPFGLATVDPSSTVEMNIRFPGQYFDSETGLHYNYFRDYDPRTGRYLESDPIGIIGGLNTYAYVENNPAIWIDSFGLDSFLASRPSIHGARHMFIVYGADKNGIGGTVRSFGKQNNGGLGEVNLSTSGFSRGTYQKDLDFWRDKEEGLAYVPIPASDDEVRCAADNFRPEWRYTYPPIEWYPIPTSGHATMNSNTAAQAIANAAAQQKVNPPPGWHPGAENAMLIRYE